MANHDEHSSFGITNFDADVTLEVMARRLELAKKDGWQKLYFDADNHGITLFGIKPPDPEEIRKAKDKRRKQYERLKREFEGGEY